MTEHSPDDQFHAACFPHEFSAARGAQIRTGLGRNNLATPSRALEKAGG